MEDRSNVHVGRNIIKCIRSLSQLSLIISQVRLHDVRETCNNISESGDGDMTYEKGLISF